MLIRRALVPIFVLGFAQAGFGASFIIGDDLHFAKKAPAIVIASALASRVEDNDGRIVTITTVSIEEVIKGIIKKETLDVYEPGGAYKDRATIIPGTPRFNDGDRYLLFLIRDDNRRWHVLDLALGKFHFDTDIVGHDVLVRDLADSKATDASGKTHQDLRREAEPFLQFLRGVANGGPPRDDYFIEAAPLVGEKGTQAFGRNLKPVPLAFSATSYTSDCDTVTTHQGCRWNSFPQTFFANVSGEPGAPGSGFTAVTTALSAWTNNAGSNINYAYGGTDATHTGGLCGAADGFNTVLWERNLVACAGVPAFTCNMSSYSGTLGIGGISATSGTHAGPNGEIFFTTTEGDVEMNQGIANCNLLFTNDGDWNGAVMHEIGHTLGFRHADQNRTSNGACAAPLDCSSSAIMTATVTHGLNSMLATWDQNAAKAVYPAGAVPPAVTSVVATATTSTNVQVSWSGSCATTCHIYRSADHLTYTQVGVSTTSPFNDTAAANTAYLYKVRAFNGTESLDSNIDLATTVFYTNTIIGGSSIIRAVDLNEMRNAVDAVRTLDGIGAGFYTYGSGSPARVTAGTDIIHAADINELRTNLNTAMNGLFGTTPTYTNTITAGSSIVQAIDFNEIRTKMQ